MLCCNEMGASQQNKYKQLLLSLIFILVIPALLPDIIDSFSISLGILLSILVFLRQFCLNNRLFRLYALFATAGFLCDGFHLIAANGWYTWLAAVAADSIYFMFLLAAVLLIGREIFVGQQVTNDTIVGGVCLYLILGVIWSLLYDNLFLLQQQAFRCVDPIAFFELLYFSFATLTTVGYGDIMPVTQLAKMAASLQGIVGILFPSVFMARLIGLYQLKHS
ncbi:MAG: ion channel [Myxococcota bacterium]